MRCQETAAVVQQLVQPGPFFLQREYQWTVSKENPQETMVILKNLLGVLGKNHQFQP